jgi:hypothetical protein
MAELSKRLRDVFSQPHEWCDTTRLANPWEVLLGGLRRPRRTGSETDEPVDRPAPDLRAADRPADKDASP